MSRIPFTHTWIEQGKILAGSIPQLPEDMHTLQSLGIQSILTLTRRDIADYPGLFISDLQHDPFLQIGHYPIPDGGIANDDVMFGAVDFLHQSLNQQLTTYVHCRGGIGRTGAILLAYYIKKRGLSLEQARDIVKVRRNYQGNASAIDQGSPQREWLEALDGVSEMK